MAPRAFNLDSLTVLAPRFDGGLSSAPHGSSPTPSGPITPGQLAAIVVGVVVAFLLLVGGISWAYIHYRREVKTEDAKNEHAHPVTQATQGESPVGRSRSLPPRAESPIPERGEKPVTPMEVV